MADHLDRIDMQDLTILRLKGTLTSREVEDIQPMFHAETHKPGARVVVDLSSVDFLATPALSMFIEAAMGMKDLGGRIVFTDTQPPVSDVMRRLKLHKVLHTAGGLDDAITQIRQ